MGMTYVQIVRYVRYVTLQYSNRAMQRFIIRLCER